MGRKDVIKNVVFDLGAVLYGIEYERLRVSFEELVTIHRGRMFSLSILSENALFREFERGKIGTFEFCEGMREIMNCKATDGEIKTAWNGLLVGVIAENVAVVEELRRKVRLVLLSNANVVHYEAIKEEIKPLLGCFEKVYFSQQIGMRKPDSEVFEYVLKECGFVASETLFIDDTLANIKGAQGVGIQTIHLTKPSELRGEIVRRMGG